MSWGGFGALLYIAFGATTVGFAIWSFLLRHYPASLVLSLIHISEPTRPY